MEILTLAIAIVTAIYTAGTFLLWLATRKTLQLSIAQNESTQKRVKAELLSNILTWHRDVFTFLLSKKNFVEQLSKEEGLDENQFEINYLLSILINNVFQIYYHYKQGNIEQDVWEITLRDVKELFNWKIVRKRWYEIRKVHCEEFKNFIDKNVLYKEETHETQISC